MSLQGYDCITALFSVVIFHLLGVNFYCIRPIL